MCGGAGTRLWPQSKNSLPKQFINFGGWTLFEKTLEDLDLVSNFVVISFNNKDIFYKVIYNGSPDKFFSEIIDLGLNIERSDQAWKIK